MTSPNAQLLVSVADTSAWIRIIGRANFSSSVDFKLLVQELQHTGHHRFALDLTECALMDSTFLGVLAGFATRLNTANSDDAALAIELLNANARVTELLENLGVDHLFRLVTGPAYAPAAPTVAAPMHDRPDAEALARTSLEAHELLMKLEPANVPKFKDVAQFLAEDLKRLKQ
ncbi:MAG: hypothetical protein RLZZ350_912 [Verrucomicrobiota bacterium]|jgi:anti-anti-sigma regulatory factor